MKYSEAIEITDNRTTNDYDTDDKVRWLMQLDQQIFDELISTHERPRRCERPHNCTGDDTLLVLEPYAEDIYISYLQSKIAKENGEAAKYNAAITLYNDAYSRFSRLYHQKHMPITKHNFLHF